MHYWLVHILAGQNTKVSALSGLLLAIANGMTLKTANHSAASEYPTYKISQEVHLLIGRGDLTHGVLSPQ